MDDYCDALSAEALDAYEATAMPFFLPVSSAVISALLVHSQRPTQQPLLYPVAPPLPLNPLPHLNNLTSSSLYSAATTTSRYVLQEMDREVNEARLSAIFKMIPSTASIKVAVPVRYEY